MNREIKISEGRVFLVSDSFGYINPKLVQGFFFDDVRHLSFYQSKINGVFPELLNVLFTFHEIHVCRNFVVHDKFLLKI